MYLPRMKVIQRSKNTVKQFVGYDHTENCEEGWFYEEENLSSRCWPALSPRLPRTKVQQLQKPHGLYAKNGLLWVDGTSLFYNGKYVGEVEDNDKQFCGLGSRVLIWPDKLCFDTENQSLQPLGAKWQAVGQVKITPALEDGREYTISHTGPEAPEKPQNGMYWMDTSGGKAVLRVYSSASESWGAVLTTYAKLVSTGIGAAFAQYDTVKISGFVSSAIGELADELNGDYIIWDRGEDYVTITALVEKVLVQEVNNGAVMLERRIPDLDYMTQQDNRVWGCCNADHTIYACKQGDPTNWFNYMGTAADSYAVPVGSDGNFTGAASCLGYVLFFKEGCIHKVYGTKPGNYQVTTVLCQGVRKGAAKTLVLTGGTLYYLSLDGVMRYDGSLPEKISEKLGLIHGQNAVAGVQGETVYLEVSDEEEKKLFVWNTRRSVWHRENALGIMQFAADGNNLYALAKNGDLWAMGSEEKLYLDHSGREKEVRWSAETGRIGLYDAEHRFVSRIVLRLEGERDTHIRIFVSWDGEDWTLLADKSLVKEQAILLPIIPRRCRQMRLKLEGNGQVRLYSISKVQQRGSEL